MADPHEREESGIGALGDQKHSQSEPPTLIGLMQTGHLNVLGRTWRDSSANVFVSVLHVPFATDGDPMQEARTYVFPIVELDRVGEELQGEDQSDLEERFTLLQRGVMSSPGGVSYMDTPLSIGRSGEDRTSFGGRS